ncbi:hypothetical protein [Erwinia oleae]|uniref:hypothetical protein n=1 Tax=Erwinia oleae TaxID=796334 RepID=UPI000AB3DF96|nr:hypothetical protein [Erwinia oleae]
MFRSYNQELSENSNKDFIRNWRTMGKILLALEAFGSGVNLYGIHQLSKGDE